MNPKNFPERVNGRRKAALDRLLNGPIKVPSEIGGRVLHYKDRERDVAALTVRIVADARGVRTKKNRAGKRRVA